MPNSLLGFLKEHHGFERSVQIISDDVLSLKPWWRVGSSPGNLIRDATSPSDTSRRSLQRALSWAGARMEGLRVWT